LDLDYAGTIINGSPFDLKIYDASRIIVSDLNRAEVNKQCEFTIDASTAGEGQLEIAINDGLIKNNVKQIKPGQYLVSFLPLKAEPYVIDVKFNNESVPGNYYNVYNHQI
jgi:filamin